MLVVGMHRSGTSAAALAFDRLGWSLGKDQLESQADINRDGFGENRAIVELNEQLLAELGNRWFQLFSLPPGWVDTEAGSTWVSRACEVIESQFPDEPRLLLKDPRLCHLLPIWLRALEQLGINSRVLLVLRKPMGVAASLLKRDSLPLRAGLLLWLQYTLAAEHHSRDQLRRFVSYESVLESGAQALAVFDDIDVPANTDCGIDPSLNHHRVEHGAVDGELQAICNRVMAALRDGNALEPGFETSSPFASLSGDEQQRTLNDLLEATSAAAARAVEIGSLHSEALEVIADKDAGIEQVSRYAAECESVVTQRDQEIAEKNAELEAIQSKLAYRVLRKLRLLR